MDSGPCGGIQSVMIWCLCVCMVPFLRVVHVVFSLNNEKSFNIDLWLIFPTLFMIFSFFFLLFFFQDQEKMMMMMMMIFSKSRSIEKLTTQTK